jgi:hypothetical protein
VSCGEHGINLLALPTAGGSLTRPGRPIYDGHMLRMRPRPPKGGFIEPCQPSLADRPPIGLDWIREIKHDIHEIKHDGYRLMARRDPAGVRLVTKGGHDWSATARAAEIFRSDIRLAIAKSSELRCTQFRNAAFE